MDELIADNGAWPADQVERWPIERLIPYARNARTHTDEQLAQLAASIREWGWTMPVLVDEDGVLIAGHGRVMAAQRIGISAVPTMTARGWSDAKIRAYRLADNQLASNAGWDEELLGLELGELRDAGADLGLLGFDGAAMQEFIAAAGNVEALTRLPNLPNGERNPFQAMTFILHDEQVEAVKAALQSAKHQGDFAGPNKNSNGNALARVCEAYVGQLDTAA